MENHPCGWGCGHSAPTVEKLAVHIQRVHAVKASLGQLIYSLRTALSRQAKPMKKRRTA